MRKPPWMAWSVLLLPFATASAVESTKFEVASVRPSPPTTTGPTIRFEPGGRFTATGISLRNLITLAYGIRDSELVGAPSWIASARYDIVAKPQNGGSNYLAREAQMMRVQALLAERFQLKVRRASEERRVLALRGAKSGIKLTQATDGQCKGTGQPLSFAMFTKSLSLQLGQPVVDETGLTGNFCILLRWSSDEGKPQSLGGTNATEQSAGPSLPTALREQLGLTLESKRAPVTVLVIEHVSQPTAN